MRRRRVTLIAVAAAMVGGLLSTASAAPGCSVPPPVNGTCVGASGFSSDNVEQVKFVPFEVGTATGARVIGHYLFVTSWKSFSIYDIKDPLNPVRISTTPIGFMFENEDVATNGKMLLFSESLPGNALHVWDLQDYANPKEVGTLSGAGDHTTSCLFNCKYGWGSSGTVSDLRRIDAPKKLGKWNTGLPGRSIHDVTEVAPGMVITASQPFMFLDARKSVTEPTLLATGTSPDRRFIHSILWPRHGQDKFILVGGETNEHPRCDVPDESAHFMVWDSTNWKKTHTFKQTDQYTYTNGAYVDGKPAVGALGCSSHWFQEHPTWHNGGLVAVGSYEHGTRFLTVSPKGKMKEVGWFEPMPGGMESAAYWITKDIVYTIDYTRGFDILKYHGPLK
ncbi:MAG: hypothetical protein QOJ92_1556 [Frankiales bacterium]|jgi:hypothetical protein|nr:hypothetical protein [Frankiales bacterium]MDX6274346.1 hypothetical protein [Frankiales bacterium]